MSPDATGRITKSTSARKSLYFIKAKMPHVYVSFK